MLVRGYTRSQPGIAVDRFGNIWLGQTPCRTLTQERPGWAWTKDQFRYRRYQYFQWTEAQLRGLEPMQAAAVRDGDVEATLILFVPDHREHTVEIVPASGVEVVAAAQSFDKLPARLFLLLPGQSVRYKFASTFTSGTSGTIGIDPPAIPFDGNTLYVAGEDGLITATSD